MTFWKKEKKKREMVIIEMTSYQQHLACAYNLKVIHGMINMGDLVLRAVLDLGKTSTDREFALTWKRPYRVSKISSTGACQLDRPNDTTLPRS